MIRPVMRCLAAARRRCSWTRTYYQTLLSRSFTKGLQPLVSTKNARIDSRQFYRLEFRRNAFESVVSSEVCMRPLTRRSKLVSLSTDVKRYSLYAARGATTRRKTLPAVSLRTSGCYLNICERVEYQEPPFRDWKSYLLEIMASCETRCPIVIVFSKLFLFDLFYF